MYEGTLASWDIPWTASTKGVVSGKFDSPLLPSFYSLAHVNSYRNRSKFYEKNFPRKYSSENKKQNEPFKLPRMWILIFFYENDYGD